VLLYACADRELHCLVPPGSLGGAQAASNSNSNSNSSSSSSSSSSSNSDRHCGAAPHAIKGYTTPTVCCAHLGVFHIQQLAARPHQQLQKVQGGKGGAAQEGLDHEGTSLRGGPRGGGRQDVQEMGRGGGVMVHVRVFVLIARLLGEEVRKDGRRCSAAAWTV